MGLIILIYPHPTPTLIRSILPLSTQLTWWFSFFFHNQFLLLKYYWLCWHVMNLPWATLLEETHLFPTTKNCQLAKQLGVGWCVCFPSPCWDLVWRGLLQVLCIVSHFLSSYVQLSCCAQEIMFSCSHPKPLALTLFLSLFHKDP